MAKARKLPSGSWRVQASVTISGETQIRSFTATTAKEAERLAEEWQNHYKMIGSDSTKMSVKEAILLYCETNKGRLSPSTYAGYIRIANNGMSDIINRKLYTLTCPIIQNSISLSAKKLSAKTIKNHYGLLQTVLSFYYPEFVWAIKYPKSTRPIKKSFSDKYISDIFKSLKNTNFEVEAYLGILSMRASEIAGAKWDDINFKEKTLHVCRAKLKNEKNQYIIVERTKTDLSDRIIYLPDYVCELLKERKETSNSEFISTVNPDIYWKRLNRILQKNGIEGLGFHKLRHIYSSVTSSLGIDAQIRMENGGWANEHIMNGSYRHAISEAQLEANSKMNDYVNKLSKEPDKFHTKFHTNSAKRLKLVRYIHVE